MKNTIQIKDSVFLLNTAHTSYLFRIDDCSHPEHIYYGAPVRLQDAEAMSLKRVIPNGDSIEYVEGEYRSWLDAIPFEWSGAGRGDFREPPAEIRTVLGTTQDFLYAGYETVTGNCGCEKLPGGYGADETLIIHLKDAIAGLLLDLYYSVYAEADVITRRCVLRNCSGESVSVRKLMSFSMDIDEEDLTMMTFNGSWAKEMQISERQISEGTYVSASRVGFSSARVNPGWILKKQKTTENTGEAWGFNLVWSGSHYASVSKDDKGNVRLMQGIAWDSLDVSLKPQESFETPESFMTYSDEGLNGVSHHFHDFINEHIVRGPWKKKERPVLVNDWEAFVFDFDEEKIVSLAAKGKELGAELFVLDDGWFGARNSDRAGLGDYTPIKEKLPNGIIGLSDRIHAMGLQFGLWFEPEAVNPDSDLYRAHPEWAIRDEGYPVLFGRHEFLLDLTLPEVQDYIVENVGRTLDEGKVDYVKWDMNRQMAARDDTYDYAYIVSLYSILDRIFTPRPEILLESCSSGGNRFDAGMMCYSPQIWTSDDTDPVERFDIQKGCSYLYPQSTMGAHVSASPHAQTLRPTPLHTRFHISAFGVLGYELDVTVLSESEKEEIRRQIEYYKEHRALLQFGRFSRDDTDSAHESFSTVSEDGSEACAAVFRRVIPAASGWEKLRVPHLAEGEYSVNKRSFLIPLANDAHLLKTMKEKDLLQTQYDNEPVIASAEEYYEAGNTALQKGIILNNVYNGSELNPQTRYPQDFGSELYYITKK